MSITVLAYHDQALVDQITAQALARAEAAKAAETAASEQTDNSFSSMLDNAVQSYTTDNTVTANVCPDELLSIFQEAATTFGVSFELLTSIGRAESNYNSNAVSSAGAVGIMQLMPATAAALGVTNSYDARENIMGGAKYISQLLAKYNGNTSLALAAYNAGSSNVEKYGGIPPFTETQNYVQKVLSYMNATLTAEATAASSTVQETTQTISDFLAENNISRDALDLFVALLKLGKTDTAATESASPAQATTPQLTVTVTDGTNSSSSGTTGTA